jgi:predicted nucleic acid-binding protein
MSGGLLLDTNVLIDAERGLPSAAEFLRSQIGEDIAISLITYGELLQGTLWNEHAPTAIHRMMQTIDAFELLTVSKVVMERAMFIRGERRKSGETLSLADVLIAATAIESRRVLITRNLRHFERIAGLNLECPY